MSASRLRRGGLPDEIGTRLDHLLVQRGDVLVLSGNLASPERSLECLVQELREVPVRLLDRIKILD
jgi:hypothetical protein